MKLILTHSDNIKTFVNISRHLELKAECIYAHRSTFLLANIEKHKTLNPKRKQQGRSTRSSNILKLRVEKVAKSQRDNHAVKDKFKLNYYNCGKMGGHFACKCTKAKKVSTKYNFLMTYVCSLFCVAHSIPK